MNQQQPRHVHEIEIEIRPDDIDQLGHVNNIIYLRWVQEVAVSHWFADADEKDKRDLLWVVARHEIDYKRPALSDDTIIARTWVGEAVKRTFERQTEIRRKSDMKVLARARTLWIPINAATRKPTEVSAEVYRRFSTNKTESE